jgi:AcrR family transcriptional regulator
MIKKQIRHSINDKSLLAKRRQQICKVATELFMAQGFRETGMRAIAEACGLTIGALYRYIGSKDDLLWLSTEYGDSYHKQLLQKMKERVKGLSPVEALRESIRMYFQNVDEMQGLYNLHNHIVWTASKELRQSIFDREIQKVEYFNRLLIEGVNAGEFEVEDTYLMAHNIVMAANAWANRRWLLRKRYTLEDYIRKQTDSILATIQVKR